MIAQTSNSPNIIKFLFNCLQSGEIEPTVEQDLQHMWASLKMTIGNLLIRGYRTFKYMLEQQCIIFMKRQQYYASYLFFKICRSKQDKIDESFFRDVNHCLEKMAEFRKKDLESFSVLVLFGLEYETVEVRGGASNKALFANPVSVQNKAQWLQNISQQFYIEECYIPAPSTQDIKLDENSEQSPKLKGIVYSYIDTFGQKTKTSLYKQLTKKSHYLLNTINLIIFQQTKPTNKPTLSTPIFNQIESASWTAFKTGKLESDRKDIVLTGNGKIMFLDLTFVYNLNNYVDTQYMEEVEELLKECSNAYNEGKVKVVKIQNSLTSRHSYSYYCKEVSSFSRTPRT